MAEGPLKIFIGSGEQSLLERKVLIYSLHKHTQSNLDIAVFNGTHNAVEKGGQPPALAPLPLHLKYRNQTEFSLYRYLIPELCSFSGRALYLDSDMICLQDIGGLFDVDVAGYDFMAKREYADRDGEKMWGLSVMLINCERSRFPLEKIFEEIDRGLYTYTEFSQMGKKFLAHHPYQIGEIDPSWNVFDHADPNTRLIHYTNLSTQPWKYPGHPQGELWFSYLREACAAGFVTDHDINLTVQRGYARPDLRQGNGGRAAGKLDALLKRLKR
jgi:lipopolysaccharide biosynthesis glycosyltransferase